MNEKINAIINDTDGKRHPRTCRKCWKRIDAFLWSNRQARMEASYMEFLFGDNAGRMVHTHRDGYRLL